MTALNGNGNKELANLDAALKSFVSPNLTLTLPFTGSQLGGSGGIQRQHIFWKAMSQTTGQGWAHYRTEANPVTSVDTEVEQTRNDAVLMMW